VGLLGFALLASLVVGGIGLVPMLLILCGIGLVLRGLMTRGRRAAGYPCDECRRIIVLEYEAELCALCVRPLHARCAKAHGERHHPKGDGPYR
jgi:hypothetical protein